MIMLLNHQGVPDHVFLRLMHEALASLWRMFTDEDVARSKLQHLKCGIDWVHILTSSFPITTDPFMRSLLMALYRQTTLLFVSFISGH